MCACVCVVVLAVAWGNNFDGGGHDDNQGDCQDTYQPVTACGDCAYTSKCNALQGVASVVSAFSGCVHGEKLFSSKAGRPTSG